MHQGAQDKFSLQNGSRTHPGRAPPCHGDVGAIRRRGARVNELDGLDPLVELQWPLQLEDAHVVAHGVAREVSVKRTPRDPDALSSGRVDGRPGANRKPPVAVVLRDARAETLVFIWR